MNKYLKKAKEKYKKDGFIKTVGKANYFVKASMIRYFTYNRSNQRKWNALKNKYKGKRAFLLGNGPSLNDTPLHLLKNEYTMCFNRINILFERLQWKPSFYTCVDATVVQDNANEINEQITPYVLNAFFTDFHMLEFTNIKKRIKDGDNVLWLYTDVNKFSHKLPNIAPAPTVAISGLQILAFLGFSEIYIIGMDMNYKIHTSALELNGNEIQSKADDDPNHFDPRYFGKGKKYHQPNNFVVESIFKSLNLAKQNLDKIGVKVYNATYGGKVECFERVNFDSLFNYTDDEEFSLFTETFKHLLPVSSFEELKTKVPTLKNIDKDNISEKFFIIDQAEYVKKSSNLIFNYIPFGPYKGISLLIHR